MANDRPVSSLVWQAPLLGAALGAFSTIKATGDDPDKSKEELLKLLVRNTTLGGLAGGGIYLGGRGLCTLLDAYNSRLPGDNRGDMVKIQSYQPKEARSSANTKKLLLLYKKAYDKEKVINSLSVGIGAGGLAALLTYLHEQEEKKNLYNVLGTGGLTGLGAFIAADQYQRMFPKAASLKKKAEDGLLNQPLAWGLPAAGAAGLLSYFTQTKGKRDIGKVLKHALTGGLIGTGSGLAYKWFQAQPETKKTPPIETHRSIALQGARGQKKTFLDKYIPTLYDKSKSLDAKDDPKFTDVAASVGEFGAGTLGVIYAPWPSLKALGGGAALHGLSFYPNEIQKLWNWRKAENLRSKELDKMQQELINSEHFKTSVEKAEELRKKTVELAGTDPESD